MNYARYWEIVYCVNRWCWLAMVSLVAVSWLQFPSHTPTHLWGRTELHNDINSSRRHRQHSGKVWVV